MKIPPALFLTLTAAHAGGIYFTNRNAGLLERALYDGSGRSTVLTSSSTDVRGLWLDIPNNRIWYCDADADTVNKLNLDGTNRSTVFNMGTGNAFPADLELNLAAGHLYFCDQQNGLIRRINLDGTGAVTLVTDPTYRPYYLDLDLVNGNIYWGDFQGSPTTTGNVYRMNLDGTGRQTVVSGNQRTRAVCADVAAAMLYWVNRDAGKIMRCKMSDLPVSAADTTKVQTLYSNLDTPHGMVLDVTAGKVYWVDTGTLGTPGSVGARAVSRGDMDGSGPHEILVRVTLDPWDVDVDPRVATYAEWKGRFFVINPGAIAAADADPDNDGILNVMECALGLHPRRPDASGLPVITSHTEAGQTYPAIRFTRRTGVTGLQVLPQHSTDLEYWWDENSPTDGIPRLTRVSTTPLPENLELVTVRSIFSLQQNPRQYLRVWAAVSP